MPEQPSDFRQSFLPPNYPADDKTCNKFSNFSLKNRTMNIGGYTIEEKVFAGDRYALYRASGISSGTKVLVKTLKKNYPDPEEITLLRNDFTIGNSIGTQGIIRYVGVEDNSGTPAIILEDFAGISLKEYLEKEPQRLKSALEISLQLSKTLEELHSRYIIHNNINPENILINPSTGQVRLMGFSIATDLKKENQPDQIKKVNELLLYIAPEQTGRLKNTIDYRSDLYSLGILLYQLFTRTSPFLSEDPFELIYYHIAKKPSPPSEINSEIPSVLSDIILRLLEKDPENRYQLASGLSYDLKKCLHLLEGTGEIAHFNLGSQDLVFKLHVPETLYCRDQEMIKLLKVFEEVSAGKQEMVLVSGYPGIGKTALINTLAEELHQSGGYFIRGKYDIQKKEVPYYGIIRAFEEFTRKVLFEKEEYIGLWQQKLLNALGNNGRLITDMVPDLELIIGEQPAMEELPPHDAFNRFIATIKRFIQACAQKEHPLIIFLDDLQWADPASIQLLETIRGEDITHLLIIGAYRDNEVTLMHPLMKSLEKMSQSHRIHQLSLEPLDQESVTRIVSRTLNSDRAYAASLSGLIFTKTQGNPFFLRQFLYSLFDDNLLKFNLSGHTWEYSLDQVEQLEITDNVVDLMISKIRKLPQEVCGLLKTAACIGNQFDLNTLSLVVEKDPGEIETLLNEALQHGLLIQIGGLHEEPLFGDLSPVVPMPPTIHYRFLHDRIHQSAILLLDDQEKKRIHFRIGRIKLAGKTDKEVVEEIFEIINHLNLASELMLKKEEKTKLAELNYLAGKKAKDTSAFDAAFNYFLEGLNFLSDDCWRTNYNIAFNLTIEAAECEYLVGSVENAIDKFDLLLEKSLSRHEKLRIYEKKCRLHTKHGNKIKAYETAHECLRLFDMHLSDNKSLIKLHIFKEILYIKVLLRNRSYDQLLNLPPLKDQEKIALLEFLETFSVTAYHLNPDLFALIMLKAFGFSLLYGNSKASPPAYMGYGIILSVAFRNFEGAYEFGKLAMKLHEKYQGGNALRFRMLYPYINFLAHIKEDLNTLFAPLQEIYQGSMQNGDPLYGGYALVTMIWNKITAGYNLEETLSESTQYLNFFKERNEEELLDLLLSRHQAALALAGKTPECSLLTTPDYDPGQRIEKLAAAGSLSTVAVIFVSRMQLLYLFEKHEEALRIALKAERYLTHINNLYLTSDYYLYQSLIFLRHYHDAPFPKKRKFRQLIKRNKDILKKLSELCPANYLSHYLLVNSQYACVVQQDAEKAELLFNRTIEVSRKYRFQNNEGLANELAAEFFLRRERHKIAPLYIREAYFAYQKWGAISKMRFFETSYKKYLFQTDVTGHSETGNILFDRNSRFIDLNSLMKASAVISRETELDNLLMKLMRIVLENAGAENGAFIIKKEDGLFIEAEGSVNRNEMISLCSIPVEGSSLVPETVIQFVAKTRESVVIEKAFAESHFSQDPYISVNMVKSLLCIPVVMQTNLIGILYLENNLSNGAFTPDRIEFLKLLSGQIAVSIENAQLQEKKMLAYREREELLQKINLHQKKLTRKIIKTQESERRRIAEDLHDGMGYLLSTFKLHFTSFLETDNHEEKDRYKNSCFLLLEDSFKELKSVSNNLMPSIVLENGLVAGVEDLCNRINNAEKLKIHLKYFNVKRLSLDYEMIIFRIVQELINNVVKHSAGKNLDIQFVYHDEELVITSEDDGKGFDYKETLKSKSGKGLHHILNRVKYLRGTVQYESVKDQGTSVIIKLPLPKKTFPGA